MRKPHQFPIEDIAEYWQLVRDVLTAGGMSKKEAAEVAKAYREYMKPAGWAFYNRDPEDAAEYAIKYAAWMRKEQEKAGKATDGPVKAPPQEAERSWQPSAWSLTPPPTSAKRSKVSTDVQQLAEYAIDASLKRVVADLRKSGVEPKFDGTEWGERLVELWLVLKQLEAEGFRIEAEEIDESAPR